jgi:hypothetical protein
MNGNTFLPGRWWQRQRKPRVAAGGTSLAQSNMPSNRRSDTLLGSARVGPGGSEVGWCLQMLLARRPGARAASLRSRRHAQSKSDGGPSEEIVECTDEITARMRGKASGNRGPVCDWLKIGSRNRGRLILGVGKFRKTQTRKLEVIHVWILFFLIKKGATPIKHNQETSIA